MTLAIPLADSAARRGRYANAAMFLVNGFLAGAWAPQIPLLLPRHQIGEFALGLLILLVGAGAIGAMSATGWLIAHFGSRKMMLGYGAASSVAFALVVLAPTIPWAIPALLSFGASLGAMDVSMNANAVELERRMGRAIMSSAHGFWSLGGFAGAAIGGPLIARFGVAADALVAAALALAVLAVAAPFALSEAHVEAAQAQKPRYVWAKGAAIYVLGVMALFSMIPEGAVLDWAALYLSKQLGAALAVSGLAFAFFSGAMALMRFAGDGLRGRFGAVATRRVSALVAAAGMLAGGLAPNAPLAIGAFALCGLGIANMVPIAFSAAGNQPGLSPGAGISLVTLIGYSGMLAAPSMIGFVAERIGFRVTYVTLAALLTIVALLARRAGAADRGSLGG